MLFFFFFTTWQMQQWPNRTHPLVFLKQTKHLFGSQTSREMIELLWAFYACSSGCAHHVCLNLFYWRVGWKGELVLFLYWLILFIIDQWVIHVLALEICNINKIQIFPFIVSINFCTCQKKFFYGMGQIKTFKFTLMEEFCIYQQSI